MATPPLRWPNQLSAAAKIDFALEEGDEGVQFAGKKLRPIFLTITGKPDFPDNHPMLEHFRFVAKHTKFTPKISIPDPSCCHFRTAPDEITQKECADPDAVFTDVASTYKKAVMLAAHPVSS